MPRNPLNPRFKWTDELKQELLDRNAAGETCAQICRDDHMPEPLAVYKLRTADASFALRYAQARDAQLESWEDEIVDISSDGRNDWLEREFKSGRIEKVLDREHFERSRLRVDAKKWIMAKRNPARYGDAMRIEGDMGPRAIIKPEPLSPAAWAEKHGGVIIDQTVAKPAIPGAIGRELPRRFGPADAEVELAPADLGKRKVE
jgi:hypothetical protein